MVAGGAAGGPRAGGSGERAVPIIEAMMANATPTSWRSTSPTEGYISNLPDGAIVEVPASVSRFGIQRHRRRARCRSRSPPSAAPRLTVASLAVDAAALGSRELMLQALLVDPMVNDIDQAKALMEEMLALQAEYLPQFQG